MRANVYGRHCLDVKSLNPYSLSPSALIDFKKTINSKKKKRSLDEIFPNQTPRLTLFESLYVWNFLFNTLDGFVGRIGMNYPFFGQAD